MENEIISKALNYTNKGWVVLPIKNKGKEPLIQLGVHGASKDRAIIQTWFGKRYPNANIGIATGKISGVFVLDIDGEEGEKSLAALMNQYGMLPPTIEQQTGGGGRHLFFSYPENGAVSKNKIGFLQGLDIKTDSGYVVVPPSIHPNGKQYEWIKYDIQIATPPNWLLELIQEKKETTPTIKEINEERKKKQETGYNEDFYNALNKCREWLKSLYTEAKIFNVRKGEGRLLTLAIMSELKANGLKDPHFTCKWLFGGDYDYTKTEKEWLYIHNKPFKSETLCAEFPEFCNVKNTTKIKSNRRIETLTDLKKNITRTTFNNDRLKSVYTIYFQNGLDFDVDATDIVKLATWKSITSAAGYVIGWRGIMNDVLDLAAWIMDNSEIVESDNPDVDETVPHVERYIYNLSYAKEKQQLRSRPIKFYEDGDILVAAATMKTIREAVNFKGSASQFYKLLFHAGLVKGRKYAANIKVWIIDSLNTHNEDKYKTQCKIIDE